MAESVEIMCKVRTAKSGITTDEELATLSRFPSSAILKGSFGVELEVLDMKRTDGRPFGVEADFEEYWRELNRSHPGEETQEKSAARDAWMTAVQMYDSRAEQQ